MPNAPQAVVVVDRKGKIVATNIESVIEWRKTHEAEVYKAAMHGLVQLIAEAAVEQLQAEKAAQRRRANGFAYFARYRLERGLTP
jgi:hypothetical protein